MPESTRSTSRRRPSVRLQRRSQIRAVTTGRDVDVRQLRVSRLPGSLLRWAAVLSFGLAIAGASTAQAGVLMLEDAGGGQSALKFTASDPVGGVVNHVTLADAVTLEGGAPPVEQRWVVVTAGNEDVDVAAMPPGMCVEIGIPLDAARCKIEEIATVVVLLGKGDDSASNASSLSAELVGGDGADRLIGGSAVPGVTEILDGGDGEDLLVGGEGADVLRGATTPTISTQRSRIFSARERPITRRTTLQEALARTPSITTGTRTSRCGWIPTANQTMVGRANPRSRRPRTTTSSAMLRSSTERRETTGSREPKGLQTRSTLGQEPTRSGSGTAAATSSIAANGQDLRSQSRPTVALTLPVVANSIRRTPGSTGSRFAHRTWTATWLTRTRIATTPTRRLILERPRFSITTSMRTATGSMSRTSIETMTSPGGHRTVTTTIQPFALVRARPSTTTSMRTAMASSG